MRMSRTLLGLGLASSLLLGPPVMADRSADAPMREAGTEARQEQDRPNILVWMLDDVGFAQLACFGGLIDTPNIDRVATRGIRFSNYHTTPICSATRAAFLTGRNSHTVHMGGHPVFPSDTPGYDTKIPASAGTIAENLRQNGYTTFALGKWDHLPLADVTPAGPHTYWPLRQGFDRFYGFLFSETNNFVPDLWRDNTPVDPPQSTDYHLSADLADQAIGMIHSRDGLAKPKPFFLYLATGTAHAPHHAPPAWIERYQGKFDQGWDKIREQILKRQIAEGIVPPGTTMAPRPQGMPAWDSLTPDEKRMYARQMEVFAAALSHADAQFGRILDDLERRGELDNTIVVVSSDNGASAEGGLSGTYNELLFATNQLPNARQNLAYYDRWGGPETFPHYAFGWAVAGNTPFRYYKQTTYEGGIRVPLIISDPRQEEAGGWRNSFVHVSDIAPTLLDLVEVEPAKTVNNTAQSPFDGMSFAIKLSPASTPKQRGAQYFEVFGHKAYWSKGWKIVSPSRLNVWDITSPAKLDQPWQLYDLNADLAESIDLAQQLPNKVEELANGFSEQAKRFNVYPIAGQSDSVAVETRRRAADFDRREGKWVYPGMISRIPKQFAPPVDRKSFTVTADLTLLADAASAPIFVIGGRFGGVGFHLSDGHPTFMTRSLKGKTLEVRAAEALPKGRQSLTLTVERGAPGEMSSVAISAGGRILASEEVDLSVPTVVPETFDIGRDDATALSDDYPANVDFPGELHRVVFKFATKD